MVVTRWQAPLVPDLRQILMMFEAEALAPWEEVLEPSNEQKDHRHPFDEIRMVYRGQLLVDVAGNRMLLRPGDKIMVPSNTRHALKSDGDEKCICICAHKVF